MINVVLLPSLLDTSLLPQSQVVVLDVLRASSTMVTALANGAVEVRLFDGVEEVATTRAALRATTPCVLAGGERGCLPVPGFDLGNSPAQYRPDVVGGATVLLSTTNGTRAATAAAAAQHLYIGSLLNAQATAEALLPAIDDHHTLFVPAGTDGRASLEDWLGAGAILWYIFGGTYRGDLSFTDTAWMAYHAFAAVKDRLPAALRLGSGGLNLIQAGFEEDIDWCAAINSRPIVAEARRDPLRVVRG